MSETGLYFALKSVVQSDVQITLSNYMNYINNAQCSNSFLQSNALNIVG